MDFAQWLNLLSAVATAAAAILIYLQIRSDQASGRLQASHGILNEFVSGTLEDALEGLELRFGWDILHDRKTYDEVVRGLDDAKIDELDRLLRRLFRRFEALCISMDYGIVNEEICREYLISLMLTVFGSSRQFVEKERTRRKEPRVFEFVQRYATDWQELQRAESA